MCLLGACTAPRADRLDGGEAGVDTRSDGGTLDATDALDASNERDRTVMPDREPPDGDAIVDVADADVARPCGSDLDCPMCPTIGTHFDGWSREGCLVREVPSHQRCSAGECDGTTCFGSLHYLRPSCGLLEVPDPATCSEGSPPACRRDAGGTILPPGIPECIVGTMDAQYAVNYVDERSIGVVPGDCLAVAWPEPGCVYALVYPRAMQCGLTTSGPSSVSARLGEVPVILTFRTTDFQRLGYFDVGGALQICVYPAGPGSDADAIMFDALVVAPCDDRSPD